MNVRLEGGKTNFEIGVEKTGQTTLLHTSKFPDATKGRAIYKCVYGVKNLFFKGWEWGTSPISQFSGHRNR